jgi:ribosomal protein L37E
LLWYSQKLKTVVLGAEMAGELFPIVLCLGCGMRVFTKSDGSCPSCGARGEHTIRTWRGEQQRVLIPERRAEWVHACLYLRPYVPRFRAAAQLRAVAAAMRPFGRTAALLDPSDRSFGRVDLHHGLGVRGMLELNFYAWIIESIYGLRRRGIDLIGKADDEQWHDTFRQAATRSRLIVLDVSVAGVGLSYEADYIQDMGLLARLVLVHRDSSVDISMVERLRSGGVPCITYSVWRLYRFTEDLRDAAASLMK